MTADVIRELVPFGIVGLAIIAILVLALAPSTYRPIAFLAMVVIAALAIIDRWLPRPPEPSFEKG